VSTGDIKVPTESFFVSESIAGDIDMDQFADPTDSTPQQLAAATLSATINFEDSALETPIASCTFKGGSEFEITACIDANFDIVRLLDEQVQSVVIHFPSGKIHVVPTADMAATVAIQATEGSYFIVAINFEKKNLLIKG
jgi:hypothetical protein